MKVSKSLNVSIRIVILFMVAMLASFVPDYAHDFFGDTECKKGSGKWIVHRAPDGDYESSNYQYCDYTSQSHTPGWHWGYRHWLFLLMGICLSIVQVVNIIHVID